MKFSPIFSFLISAWYSVNNGLWTHSACYTACHHWHNLKQNIGLILKWKNQTKFRYLWTVSQKQKVSFELILVCGIHLNTGADPGFPIGRGANPPGRGYQHTNLPDFLKNCMKLRNFGSLGGWGARGVHARGMLGHWNRWDFWKINSSSLSLNYL